MGGKVEDRFLKKERQIIDIQIQEFLHKGIISCCIFQEEQIISPIFLRPKPDGSHRVIFNLKSLNDSVVYVTSHAKTYNNGFPLNG